MFKDTLFNKIEKKTNISKNTILSLAKKIQKNNMKDENAITEIIDSLSKLTGKEVSKEKREKIIEAIKRERIPKNIENLF